jgi:hypothetical protein
LEDHAIKSGLGFFKFSQDTLGHGISDFACPSQIEFYSSGAVWEY